MNCLVFCVVVLSCALARAQDVTVSAAVSLKEALTDVAARYKQQTKRDVQLNFGATGHLLAQIREGAPVDLFIAASAAQMDQAGELIDPSSRRIIASNILVLIVPAGAKETIQGFDQLADTSIRRVAIGQPKIVPAGDYAMQAIRHLKLEAALGERIVFGQSVRQVLDYVERGEVDAGVVYATDAMQARDKVRVVATSDGSWHDPIQYVAAVVKASPNRAGAGRFIEFVLRNDAQAVLGRRGFVPPPATQPARP